MAPAWKGDGPADSSPEAGRQRLIVAALVVVCVAFSAIALQNAFDAGDRRRALAALATTPAGGPGGPSIAEALRARNRGAPARCAADVVSAVRGITQVTCTVSGDDAPYRFRWDDIRRGGLRPDEETGRRLAR